jgi:hypothetical protein
VLLAIPCRIWLRKLAPYLERKDSHGECDGVDAPDRAEFAKEIEELLWRDVEAIRRLVQLGPARRTITNLKFLTKRALCENDMLAEVVCWPRAALQKYTQCGEARTYRLTSGAIFFPPRLILWRLIWATGKGVWLRNQKKMCGLRGSMEVGDAVGARGTNQEGARPVHNHVGRFAEAATAAARGFIWEIGGRESVRRTGHGLRRGR